MKEHPAYEKILSAEFKAIADWNCQEPTIIDLTDESLREMEILFLAAILNPLGPTLYVYGALHFENTDFPLDRKQIIEVQIHHTADDVFREVGFVEAHGELHFKPRFYPAPHCQLFVRGHALSKRMFAQEVGKRVCSLKNQRVRYNLAFRYRKKHPLQRETAELKGAIKFRKLHSRLKGGMLRLVESIHPHSPDFFRGKLNMQEVDKFVALQIAPDYVLKNLQAFMDATSSLRKDRRPWLNFIWTLLEKCDVDKVRLDQICREVRRYEDSYRDNEDERRRFRSGRGLTY